jgi:hypothetical protein
MKCQHIFLKLFHTCFKPLVGESRFNSVPLLAGKDADRTKQHSEEGRYSQLPVLQKETHIGRALIHLENY